LHLLIITKKRRAERCCMRRLENDDGDRGNPQRSPSMKKHSSVQMREACLQTLAHNVQTPSSRKAPHYLK
jgi:hypothetical protein